MRVSPRLKIGLGLVVVFGVGVLTGVFGHARYAEWMFTMAVNTDNWPKVILKGMDEDLDLSPEQEAKAEALISEFVEEVNATFRELGREMVRLHVRMQPILTPEQSAKSQASFQKFREALRVKHDVTLPPEEAVKGKGTNSVTSAE